MDTPATEIPWYQFSLRSMLAFTACVEPRGDCHHRQSLLSK